MRETPRPATEIIEPDYRRDRQRGPDQPARNVCAEVVRQALKDLVQPRGVSDDQRPRWRASAAAFLASDRAAPFFQYLSLDQGRVLRQIGYAEKARAVLDAPAAEKLTDEEERVVRTTIRYLETT